MTEQQTMTFPTTRLSDGRSVAIRPLDGDDLPALLVFGQALPQDDLLFLEDDFQSSEMAMRLVNARFAENWRQLVAEADGAIVAYSAARRLHGWSRHVADITLVVSESWRRSGLGTAMARAIVEAARELAVSKVIVEVLEAQTAGCAIFERLGFRVEGAFRAHARDRLGQPHDLLILASHI
jgi:ribosomal protein S18 acetylase RimI-like enzyme